MIRPQSSPTSGHPPSREVSTVQLFTILETIYGSNKLRYPVESAYLAKQRILDLFLQIFNEAERETANSISK
jgi:hypothetical protein